MARNNMLHDGKPEARAALGAAFAGIDTIESLGEAGQMFEGNARSIITNRERRPADPGSK